MAVLPLDDAVNVVINLSPRSAVRTGFNLSLILSGSSVLSTDNRVAVYSSLEAMIDAGFTTAMPEYKAAQIYFAQSSRPGRVAIGYQASGETLAEAIAACRAANRDWYGVVPIGSAQPPSMSDLTGAAAVVEALTPATIMFAALDNATMITLKGLAYRRTLGFVTTNTNIAVAALGWAMGANTGLKNSAYTLKFKRLEGVTVDALTEAQVSDALAAYGNVYVNRGDTYDGIENGTMADGTWFDEMINLDMLANNIQKSVCDLLYGKNDSSAYNRTPKIPQTEAGVLQIINSFIPELEKAVDIGFAAPGIWTLPGFLTLEQGDAIEKGYLVLSEEINDQSPAEREARLAPTIYVALKLAGAIHSVVININVNR